MLWQPKKVSSECVYIYAHICVQTQVIHLGGKKRKHLQNLLFLKGKLMFIKLLSLLNLPTHKTQWLIHKPWNFIKAKLLLSESLAVNFGYCRRCHWTAYSRTSRWTLWHWGHAVRRILTCWRKWSITRHTQTSFWKAIFKHYTIQIHFFNVKETEPHFCYHSLTSPKFHFENTKLSGGVGERGEKLNTHPPLSIDWINTQCLNID